MGNALTERNVRGKDKAPRRRYRLQIWSPLPKFIEENSPMQWEQIEDYPGYWISEYGQVWSQRGKGKFIKPSMNNTGYWQCTLYSYEPKSSWGWPKGVRLKKSRVTNFSIHTLVATAFIGPRPEGYVIDYIDGNYSNLHYENLHWVPQNLKFKRASDEAYGAKLTAEKVKIIRKSDLPFTHFAELWGVTPTCISDAAIGRTWKHIKPEGKRRRVHYTRKSSGKKIIPLREVTEVNPKNWSTYHKEAYK